jgi:hypothetical protein
MLAFDTCMTLLRDAGVPVAPFAIIEADATPDPQAFGFPGPYAIKLADVPHRTELGAVRTGVPAEDVGATVRDLRQLAGEHKLPARVVVQPQVEFWGEGFVGAQPNSEIGPLVVCGVGGILVELLRKVSGRLAPISTDEAAEMLDELADAKIFDGYRGSPAWDRQGLVQILLSVSQLAVGSRGWLESLDINPIVFGPQGYLALDGLALIRPPAAAE